MHHKMIANEEEGFETSRKLIGSVEESKEERSSEDSISDMGDDKEGPPKADDDYDDGKESSCKRDTA